MQRPPCSGSITFVALGLAAVLACAPAASSRTCSNDSSCPAGSRCTSGACVVNSPPSAALALPTDARANVLLSFDASGSADPDPGDSVASFAWTFRALGAPCAAPVVAGTGPIASVRFGCAGRYAVDVTAIDRMGASAAKTAELEVAANTGPALVTAGADMSRDHACAGAPLRCSTAGEPVSLSASTTAAEGVAFAWTVEPPADRPISATRRVAFTPGPDVAQPTVTIETDGDAMSGDWIFRVEARDASGVIGTAATRVSVLNRAPAIIGAPAPVPEHAFDGTSFTASGQVTYTVTDPDGDLLLAPIAEHRHTGDGNSTFAGEALDGPPRVTFSIAVPYPGSDPALWLIGGAELDRTIALTISDVNGAMDVETWPIVVHNRPPTFTAASGLQAVHHRFDAPSARYLADATVGTWSDPDGDPLSLGGGSGSCASFEVVGGGSVLVHCSAPYPGAPSLGGIVGQRLVSWNGKDPWTLPAPASTWVEVLNRAPQIVKTSATVSVACIQGGCCRTNADGECADYNKTLPTGWVSAPGVLADDDGDPLNVTVDGTVSAPCVASTCGVSAFFSQKVGCGGTSATATVNVSASDGASTATGAVTITARCQ